MTRGPMRLLIAEYNFSGGTETVSIGIVPELARLAECVVWAMPKHRSEHYKKIIPPSDRLIYEPLFWPERSFFSRHIDGMLRRVTSMLPLNWKSLRGIVAKVRGKIANAWLRQIIRRHRITHFFTTWIFNQEIPKLPVPIGGMVMDLNWHRFPENFPESDRRTLDGLFARWLREADVLFPISEFTGEEMRDVFPQARARVQVVPHGTSVRTTAAVCNRLWKRPFFYYPASVFAHKDHKTLIAAAMKAFARGADFDLVFSGARTECFLHQSPASDALSESVRALCSENATLIGGRIHCLGFIDRRKVGALYDAACAVVLPSRFEGFGLPLLEAVECGARVICTEIPPFAEQIRRYEYEAYSTVFPAGAADILSERLEACLKARGAPQPSPEEIALKTQRWTWKDAAAAYIDGLSKSGSHC